MTKKSASLDAELRRAAQARPREIGAGEAVPFDDGLLLKYRAGEISSVEQEQVEQQLIASAEARALLDALGREEDALDSADPELHRMAAEIRPHLRLATRSKAGRSRMATSLGAFGAIAAAAVVSLVFFSRSPDPGYRLEQAGFLQSLRGVEDRCRGPQEAESVPSVGCERRPSAVNGEGPASRKLDDVSRWVLRFWPDSPQAEAPAVGLFRVDDTGMLRPIDLASVARMRTAGGAVELEIQPSLVFDGAGPKVVHAFLARHPREIQSVVGLRRSEVEERGLGWWRLDVTYLGSDALP